MSNLKQQVIELLKQANQELVFFQSKVCPVRSLVGESYRDLTMKEIFDQLEEEGIVEYTSGFTSLSEGVHLYHTCCVLTESFFNQYNLPRKMAGTQLSLF